MDIAMNFVGLSILSCLSRMDHSAVGHDYIGKVEKHESKRDYSTGFGGKFGVQTDRQDKVCNGTSTTDRIGQVAGFKIKLCFNVMADHRQMGGDQWVEQY
jgi:hypothetical protein